jgi:hypothetical protein
LLLLLLLPCSPWCREILPAALAANRRPDDDLCHTPGFACDLQVG